VFCAVLVTAVGKSKTKPCFHVIKDRRECMQIKMKLALQWIHLEYEYSASCMKILQKNNIVCVCVCVYTHTHKVLDSYFSYVIANSFGIC
jgi:hypothetical protein